MISVFLAVGQQPLRQAAPVAVPTDAHKTSSTDLCVESTDFRLLELLKDDDGAPQPIWRVINGAAALKKPSNRAERDRLRLWTWQRLHRLIKAGAVTRRGPWVRLGSAPIPRELSRGSTRIQKAGQQWSQKDARQMSAKIQRITSPPVIENQKRIGTKISTWNPANLESPSPIPRTHLNVRLVSSPAKVRDVAQRLAAHRWQFARKRTGEISGRRVRLGQTVLLPFGDEARVLFAGRGCTLLEIGDVRLLDDCKIWAARASELRLCKNPSAITLGRKKFGTKERPSSRKVAACRNNGCVPPRPGSRPRGRPKKLPATLEYFFHRVLTRSETTKAPDKSSISLQ
jgi:hypothetical protein